MKANQKRVAVYPVGTIRIRKGEGSRGNQRCRMIKVRMDGPIGRRWIAYSRYLWELRYGPVPPGKVVGRLDGNMMNDAIGNLRLMTMGDVVGLAHMRDPQMSEKNYRKCSKATAKMNSERAKFRRGLEYLPSKWYAVFPTIDQIWNEPTRKRNQLYRACGINDDWRIAESASLGFAGHNLLEACCLLVGDVDSFDQMVERVNKIRTFAGWSPANRGSVSAALWGLRKAGLLEKESYRFTEMVEVARTRKTPVIAIRGDRLAREPLYEDLQKVWDVEGVCVRCGCHETDACLDENGMGCHWIRPGLCSACDREGAK